jgi:hypothetical protein
MQTQLTDTFRESVLSVLGAPPDPAPLAPETLEVANLRGMRREKVRYCVSPNEWAYAWLFIPANARNAPAVYVHHRRGTTWEVGKSEAAGLAGDKDYALALELAGRGYVTFAPDAIGFEDRRAPDSTGLEYDQAYNFHQLALRLLRGETLLKKVVWDISRGVDYLETRPEVNAQKIGFIGHGYGSKMAFWAAALEPRLRATATTGEWYTYREQLRRGEWFQPEFVVPRLMQVADLHHVLSMVAPRPFLLSISETSLENSDVPEIYRKSAEIYKTMGAPNRLTLYTYPGEGLKASNRNRAYEWLDSWLMPY